MILSLSHYGNTSGSIPSVPTLKSPLTAEEGTNMRLEGKVALISGGARGMGPAEARFGLLAPRGHLVIMPVVWRPPSGGRPQRTTGGYIGSAMSQVLPSLVSRKWLDTRSIMPALPWKGRKDDRGEGMSHNFADVKLLRRQYT